LHEKPNDQTEQAKNGGKDLNGENLNKKVGVSSIGQRCATSIDANANTADEVAHAHGQTRPKQRVAGKVVGCREEEFWVCDLAHLGGEDDGHDDAVDSYDLAENDRDQVFGPYPWCLDTATDD